MSLPTIPSWGLINLSSVEIAKGCIFYATGRINLKKRDIISCGVNFYYGIFHTCVSVIALTPSGSFLKKGIIEWKNRFNAPHWYLPCSHKKLITEVEIVDRELAEALMESKEIREYLNYGPYVCSDHTPDWQPKIFTCEIENIEQKLDLFNSRLFNLFDKIPELVNRYLKEDIQKFVFCLWGDQIMKIFEGKLIFSDDLNNESKKIWLKIGKICAQNSMLLHRII